ncbi:MAG: sensor histidine kinase [Spirochaetaceae bacterium]|nr:sensor histidine kinase [Spirochaetaceae bacterium]MCF7947555.1 sensor histidine kinase [Spirochaetia bacterium]MCF7950479.1 sensor histidine kinase [Spirochaetaceae bacterium]
MHRSICDFALDLVQNSIEAQAALVMFDFFETEEELTVFVADNGTGMTPDQLQKARDPFFTDGIKHSERNVGLGLAFLTQAIEQSGGEFEIDSREGQGTSVKFQFDKTNIDTPPVGSAANTFLAALTYPGEHEMVINRKFNNGADIYSYSLTRSELSEAVGGFETSGSLRLLRTYLRSQEGVSEEQAVSRKK